VAVALALALVLVLVLLAALVPLVPLVLRGCCWSSCCRCRSYWVVVLTLVLVCRWWCWYRPPSLLVLPPPSCHLRGKYVIVWGSFCLLSNDNKVPTKVQRGLPVEDADHAHHASKLLH
jgi:hypothetical protein